MWKKPRSNLPVYCVTMKAWNTNTAGLQVAGHFTSLFQYTAHLPDILQLTNLAALVIKVQLYLGFPFLSLSIKLPLQDARAAHAAQHALSSLICGLLT